MLVYLPFLFSITLALLFFDIANGFQVALEGASTTTVPASVTGTFQRESGDPSGITIRVVDISDPSGPRVIQTEDPPDSEQSGSFPITLTTPGVFALQAGPGTSTVVDSDTVTVLDSTGSSNGKVITTSTASASSQTKDTR
ncbi:hypothetical protein BDP27DRAFT_1329567 [Rhodocollybia butyracea]|uniref:Carboxypeptidase regulatory-like domain-containing protein n=1 Tax=Rhodocollybia butyracea TaxID=206335 RepID=A0A9P5U5S2_9AGAR|nr:hypothetical protein BDP27DRAFT_1329567 [Rhodocollybia butyracea]